LNDDEKLTEADKKQLKKVLPSERYRAKGAQIAGAVLPRRIRQAHAVQTSTKSPHPPRPLTPVFFRYASKASSFPTAVVVTCEIGEIPMPQKRRKSKAKKDALRIHTHIARTSGAARRRTSQAL